MRLPVLLSLVAAASFAAPETPHHIIELYNGSDLAGWEYIAPGKETLATIAHSAPEKALAVTGKPNDFIATTASYANYQLHFEWRWSENPGNAGVLLHITEGPMDRIWPVSFQVQMKHGRVGDLRAMAAAKFLELPTPGSAPAQLNRVGADAEKPAGAWNACDIICRGDTIDVTVNGVVQNRVTKCVPSSGRIGFQLEGAPYELRNLRLAPLPPAIGASYQSETAF